MATEKQTRAMIVAEAASFMARNNIDTVNESVVAYIMEKYIPDESVPNDVIATAISSLRTDVGSLTGMPIYAEMTAGIKGTSRVN